MAEVPPLLNMGGEADSVDSNSQTGSPKSQVDIVSPSPVKSRAKKFNPFAKRTKNSELIRSNTKVIAHNSPTEHKKSPTSKQDNSPNKSIKEKEQSPSSYLSEVKEEKKHTRTSSQKETGGMENNNRRPEEKEQDAKINHNSAPFPDEIRERIKGAGLSDEVNKYTECLKNQIQYEEEKLHVLEEKYKLLNQEVKNVNSERNNLIKEREYYEKTIKELKTEIEILRKGEQGRKDSKLEMENELLKNKLAIVIQKNQMQELENEVRSKKFSEDIQRKKEEEDSSVNTHKIINYILGATTLALGILYITHLLKKQ